MSKNEFLSAPFNTASNRQDRAPDELYSSVSPLKAGSQYDAGPRVAMRQHAMRHDAQIELFSIHASRYGASRFIVRAMFTISRRNIAQRIATRGPASYCEPAFTRNVRVRREHPLTT